MRRSNSRTKRGVGKRLDKNSFAELSKLLAYILRHDIKNKFRVDLDPHCYANIDQLLKAITSQSNWTWVTREDINEVAARSVYHGQKRFLITGNKIKATYKITRNCPSTMGTTPKTGSPLPFLGNEWYVILSKQDGKCLDVSHIGTDSGTKIIQYDYWGGENQQWRLEPAGWGYYRFTAKHSGKCLDVRGMSKDNGATIQQWHYLGGDNQKWKLEPVGDGYYRIIAKHSGKCLDAGGRSTDKRAAHIRQWSFKGKDPHQLWKLESAAELDQRTARV